MKINCLIVDDEAIARKGLEKYIKEIDFLHPKGICKNAMEANTLINEEKIDLLFLDIEMPMISGLDFLKSLRVAPKVIFTTAYSEYALDSFQFEVIDYLVKPISFERFIQAANKAYRIFAKENNISTIKSIPEQNEDEFIFVKTDKSLVKIFHRDILFIHAMQNYIQIFTKEDTHLTLVPLKKVFEMLPHKDFLQVHKSFIIAKSKVEAIVGNQVLIGDHRIPIARSFKEQVLNDLVGNKVLKK